MLYLLVMAGCLVLTLPLELVLKARVYARWRRLLTALAPTVITFVAWDLYAIHDRQWTYERRWMSGVLLPGRLPLEELLFFLVVPLCAILGFEAVRAVLRLPAGDE